MTYTHLKTAILPLYIKQTDPQANINEIERLVSLPVLKDTDVIVLPELFSTGFIAEPETILKYAEPTDGPTLNAIRRLSSQTGAAFAGSFICNAGNRFYNRAFFIEPDGKAAYYDKRHLFSVSPESRVLAPGRERSPIVRYKGWTFSMVICYDIRFPVWCRNVGQLYEVLLVPANWPNSRAYAWEHLLIGRAIENQCYIAGANRSGNDDYGNYDNLSFLIDPSGKPCGITDMSTGIITAEFDRDYLEEVRRRLPVDRDAENFNISDL